MKEKKLTDEEIVKALECCTKSRCDDETTGDCPLKKDESCSTILAINALDLINRQKAEIKRLTEENRKLGNEWDITTRYCAELQKQVDDGKKLYDFFEKLCYDYHKLEGKCKQAVKDTAKEILQGLIDKAYVNDCIDLTIKKETAEKFAERAKEEAFAVFMGEPIIRASKIDEICEEVTEGEKCQE